MCQDPYLGRKLQARQGLVQMHLQWADHDKHERLRVAAQRKLQQISQLERVSVGKTTSSEANRRGRRDMHTLLFL